MASLAFGPTCPAWRLYQNFVYTASKKFLFRSLLAQPGERGSSADVPAFRSLALRTQTHGHICACADIAVTAHPPRITCVGAKDRPDGGDLPPRDGRRSSAASVRPGTDGVLERGEPSFELLPLIKTIAEDGLAHLFGAGCAHAALGLVKIDASRLER